MRIDAANSEPGWMKYRSLAVHISQPLPLDEISEETLADIDSILSNDHDDQHNY